MLKLNWLQQPTDEHMSSSHGSCETHVYSICQTPMKPIRSWTLPAPCQLSHQSTSFANQTLGCWRVIVDVLTN